MKPQQSPRFDVKDPEQAKEMLAYLEKEGYAIVAGVADQDHIEAAKKMFWDFAEKARPKVSRKSPATWNRPDWLPSEMNGILGQFGFAHSDFCWTTRTLPGVHTAFSNVWGTKNLIVSYDGGNAFRPWKYNPDWITEGGWWHVDQNSLKDGHHGRVCVQGLVSYYDATDETGGLCVIPKSHLQHDQLCRRTPLARMGMDFIEILPTDPILDMDKILVCAKAGDLLLWDSRTVHCNSPALLSNIQNHFLANPYSGTPVDDGNWDIVRLVGYVCMLPFSHAPEKVIEQRKEAFIHHIATNHWPNLPIVFNQLSKEPRDIASCPKEMLDLVGYR